MKRTLILLAALVAIAAGAVMCGYSGYVSAQPQPDVVVGGPGVPGMPGGPGMPGMGGGPGGPPPFMMGGGPGGATAIVATEKYVYVVRGNWLYQFKAEPKLELVTRVSLGDEQAVRQAQPEAQRQDRGN